LWFEVLLHFIDRLKDPSRVRDQIPPVSGNSTVSSCPLKQLLAEMLFQASNLVADRRLRDVQTRGGC
jgi:hypothetical protein